MEKSSHFLHTPLCVSLCLYHLYPRYSCPWCSKIFLSRSQISSSRIGHLSLLASMYVWCVCVCVSIRPLFFSCKVNHQDHHPKLFSLSFLPRPPLSEAILQLPSIFGIHSYTKLIHLSNKSLGFFTYLYRIPSHSQKNDLREGPWRNSNCSHRGLVSLLYGLLIFYGSVPA